MPLPPRRNIYEGFSATNWNTDEMHLQEKFLERFVVFSYPNFTGHLLVLLCTQGSTHLLISSNSIWTGFLNAHFYDHRS